VKLAAPASHRCLRFAALIVLLEMALVSAGCASPGANEGNASESESPGAVTGEELRQASFARNTYDALEQLRPLWLRPRGRTSLVEDASVPVVYVSGIKHGGVTSLRGIEVNDVRQIDFMSPLDAQTRYGIGHSGGVIVVVLSP
jgi:hypothetical protein